MEHLDDAPGTQELELSDDEIEELEHESVPHPVVGHR